ncbi:MAG: hypothetical protein KGZ68_17170, partial [Dechloromonas sp.]|nr:hypothetical protein [Dechloromonas sp.]
EPVAWCHLQYNEDGTYFADCLQYYPDSYGNTPLYTAPQPAKPAEQEPVAVVVDAYDTPGLQWLCQHPPKCGDRLYTAPQPPQQTAEWADLPPEEIKALVNLPGAGRPRTAIEMAYAVQAKLREKNGGGV